MLLQVDGWFGAGKSVLWMLLDGHPEVFCSPIHDYSYCAFINQGNDLDWVKTKHTEILRKALARTQYYKFEKVFWDGFMSFEFSTEEILKLPYEINYYNFDFNFINELMKQDKWTLEKITDILYKSILQEMYGEEKPLPKYFASMSNALFLDYYKNIPLVFPHGKSIQVRRSVEKIIATRSNRKPRPEDFKTWSFFSDGFEKRINEGEVEKILSFYDEYDRLVKEYPDKFFVIQFDDLVYNTEKSMHVVADFLGIPFDKNLLIASYCGKELLYNGRKYIGQENDNIDQLLNKNEQQIIKDRIKNYYNN